MAASLALLLSQGPAMAEGTTDIALLQGDVKIPLKVEIATTEEEHEQGLMFRKSLAANTGMLFVYERPAMRKFWMKNTLIPLDIIFFNRKAEISYIHTNAQPESLGFIGPDTRDTCAVLEIAGGEAERLGLKTGDKLAFKAEKPCE